MSDNHAAGRVICITTVEHFTGARHTRDTYYARYIVVDADGAEVEQLTDCGHTGHRTIPAAVTCGKAMARKYRREEATK